VFAVRFRVGVGIYERALVVMLMVLMLMLMMVDGKIKIRDLSWTKTGTGTTEIAAHQEVRRPRVMGSISISMALALSAGLVSTCRPLYCGDTRLDINIYFHGVVVHRFPCPNFSIFSIVAPPPFSKWLYALIIVIIIRIGIEATSAVFVPNTISAYDMNR
jgi:hypothetical protein